MGYKHYFFPALAKARELIEAPEFGAATSMNSTYPLRIAPPEQAAQPPAAADHLDLCHPASAIHRLMGDIERSGSTAPPTAGARPACAS